MMTVKFTSAKAGKDEVFSRFGPEGIPVTVRNELRAVIPDLTRRVGAQVDANLSSGLKSRRRLVVRNQMVENATSISGRVSVVATEPPAMLPAWLESGTKAHVIAARNAKVLSFYWDRIGKQAFFKQVNHPGFAGIQYMQNAFDSMEGDIRRTISRAVRDGLGAR